MFAKGFFHDVQIRYCLTVISVNLQEITTLNREKCIFSYRWGVMCYGTPI